MPTRATMFDRVGGEPFFEALTRRFYDLVGSDPLLRPLYPPDPEGLESSRVHLKLFLVQYWGGPAVYLAERGQPRLRARHAQLAIGQAERDRWVELMTRAIRSCGLGPLDETQMIGYLSAAATSLINAP